MDAQSTFKIIWFRSTKTHKQTPTALLSWGLFFMPNSFTDLFSSIQSNNSSKLSDGNVFHPWHHIPT